jgi:hypothetical protein
MNAQLCYTLLFVSLVASCVVQRDLDLFQRQLDLLQRELNLFQRQVGSFQGTRE